jgi:hypothetical protein
VYPQPEYDIYIMDGLSINSRATVAFDRMIVLPVD